MEDIKLSQQYTEALVSSQDDITTAYHRWYFHTKVQDKVMWQGVPCLKSVLDMWNYQEIISELRPSLIVELGVYKGGSTLFLHDLLKLSGKILAVDIDLSNCDPSVRELPGVEFMECSSDDVSVAFKIEQMRGDGQVFCIIDSDHHKSHVLSEMENLRDVLKPGDYVIVEDSNLNYPIDYCWPDGDSPYDAVVEYFERYPNDYVRDTERERKFGFTFATNGFLIKQ